MGALLPSLITGLVTGVIALSGVIYTQRQAANREDDKWQREENRLTGERDWQRELRHASALQDACAEFGAAIVHVRHLSLRFGMKGTTTMKLTTESAYPTNRHGGRLFGYNS